MTGMGINPAWIFVSSARPKIAPVKTAVRQLGGAAAAPPVRHNENCQSACQVGHQLRDMPDARDRKLAASGSERLPSEFPRVGRTTPLRTLPISRTVNAKACCRTGAGTGSHDRTVGVQWSSQPPGQVVMRAQPAASQRWMVRIVVFIAGPKDLLRSAGDKIQPAECPRSLHQVNALLCVKNFIHRQSGPFRHARITSCRVKTGDAGRHNVSKA